MSRRIPSLLGIAATAFVVAAAMAFVMAADAAAEQTYQKPPQAVLEVLDAPPFPAVWISPTRQAAVIGEGVAYPSIADLARPKLRLAGVRIDPATNGPHRDPYTVRFTLKRIPDGRETPIELPAGARVGPPHWTADGTRFAFTNTARAGIELWVADVATARAKRIDGVRLNGVLGSGIRWLPDQRTLLVKSVPPGRGPAPPAPEVPAGPNVQEASGMRGIGSTYETRDVLRNEHDEALFDYYFQSRPLLIDADGKKTELGRPDIYTAIVASPDGSHFLVERLHRPYSRLHQYWRFPRKVDVWNRAGRHVLTLAELPLADQVPIHGVPTGRRSYHWRPTAPATLVWIEALDGGDPSVQVPHRDRMLMWAAPFSGDPAEILRLDERYDGLEWSERGGLALLHEYDRERRWERSFLMDFDRPNEKPKLVWDMSINERYAYPGDPIYRTLPNGFGAIMQEGDWIYLSGVGASPGGDRPFLDRFNLRTRETERLFRSEVSGYESFAAWVDPARGRFLTRRESPRDPPNYFIRTLGPRVKGAATGEAARTSSSAPFTSFPDPTPQLRAITRRIVTYERADGVPLSFTLFLPPGYKEGTRLPTVLWAYPLEYSDPGTAGQVRGSEQRFTQMGGASHLAFLLDGYAVLHDPAMPAIGHPDSVYNNYLDQLIAGAKAAIDKAVAMGVTDPDRIGVGGHSHGGFMTANLLAHSDLFRAGIARSGAYNHTIRPFGFQGERRTLYDARDSYIRLSPMLHADKINEPLLLIHGEEDANPGTIPFQSDLLYRAIAGTGGTTRLVMLPLESHGYEARESVEHALWEMLGWFGRYVKNAPPRSSSAGGSAGGPPGGVK